MNVKMVVVVRKDLKMRRGKEVAQGGHAFMAWLTRRLRLKHESLAHLEKNGYVVSNRLDLRAVYEADLSAVEEFWIGNAFKKVAVQVNSENELREIYKRAIEAGLEASLIIDNGLTEFNGVPTPTCVGIGPDEASKIDAVTGHLKLY